MESGLIIHQLSQELEQQRGSRHFRQRLMVRREIPISQQAGDATPFIGLGAMKVGEYAASS